MDKREKKNLGLAPKEGVIPPLLGGFESRCVKRPGGGCVIFKGGPPSLL